MVAAKGSTVIRSLAFSSLVVCLLLCLSGFAWAEAGASWIPLSPATDRAPRASLLESDFSRISLDVEIPGMWSQTLTTSAGDFSLLSIPDAGAGTAVGEPNLPVISKTIQIPFGAEASVSLVSFQVVEKSLAELGLAERLAPVQPPRPKIAGGGQQAQLVIREAAYQQDAFLPEERVKLGEVGIIRGHRFVTVFLYPVSYNPQKGLIRIYSQMQVKVALSGADLAKTQEELYRYASPPFEGLCGELFVNYPSYAPMAKSAPPVPMAYLIITHQNFYAGLAPLVEWKTRKGFQVTVAQVPQIGSTTAEIKAYIQDAYDNWDVPPTYVLFVGDTDYIPAWSGSYSSGAPTDLYYVKMDPNYLGDIFRGRLPAKSLAEANDMIAKIMYYENPTSSDLSWMQKACFIAAEDLSGFAEDTHNYVMENYVLPNGMICDTIWESQGGSGTMITSAVNEGRSIVCYSGHGSELSWSSVPYNQTNIRNLSNADEYPLVLSHACLTGKYSVSECFGETWAKAADKGGIAFWGASNLTYWDEDDILEKAMFQAAFVETCYSIGNMTDRALYELYQFYSGGGMSRYYLDVYNILGDPSLDVWTFPAEPLSLDMPSSVNPGPNTVEITVEDDQSQPVSGALVCLYKGAEVFETGYTDAAGQVTLYPDPLTSGQVEVTVTAHNFLPFQGGMEVGAKAGDMTGDGQVDLGDAIFLLNYLYKSGPSPDPLSLGDVNCDGQVEMGDAIFLLNYLYREGPPPCSS